MHKKGRHGRAFLFCAFFIWVLIPVSVLLSIFLLKDKACFAAPIGLNANWSYQQMGGDMTSKSFLQNYNVDFSNEITNAIYMSGAMRYSRSWIEGVNTTTLLNPNLSMGINNDLFRFDLSWVGSERTNSNSSDFSDRSWEASWSSNWQKKWWPRLRFMYGQSYSGDNQSPSLVDSDASHVGANIDWDLSVAQLSYSYFGQKNSDNVTHTENKSDTHSARLQTGGSFWNDRLTLGFSQQCTLSTNNTTALAGAGGEVVLKDDLISVTSGVNRTPIYGVLSENSALHDSNFNAEALQIPQLTNFDYINIGIIARPQTVDLVYLYTTADISFIAKQFAFDLYVSDDGVNWTKKATGTVYNYNPTFKRFEVSIPRVENKYLKLVVTQTPLSAVSLTEVEAYRREVVTGGFLERFQYITYNTDFNLGFRFTNDLNLAYNLSMQDDIQHPTGNNDRRYTRAGSLRWTPTKYFSPTLSASETKQVYDLTTSPDTLNRSYALRIASAPLPTLDISTGLTKSEDYQNNKKTSNSYNYNLYAAATLFPDLNASLDMLYNSIDTYGEGQKLTTVYVLGSTPLTQSVNEAWANATRTFGSRLTLTARLTPSVTADFTGDYNKSFDALGLTSKSATTTVSWRASDLLSLRGSLGHTWEDQATDSTFLNMMLSIAPTYKTQASVSYSYAQSTSSAQSYGLFWSWNISRFISFNLNGTYQVTDGKTPWYVGSQLNTRFSGF